MTCRRPGRSRRDSRKARCTTCRLSVRGTACGACRTARPLKSGREQMGRCWPRRPFRERRSGNRRAEQKGKRHLILIDASGAGHRSLSQDVDVRGAAAWSPDGKQIVTGGNDAQGPGLFLVPVDGGAPRRIGSGPAFDPAWSPTEDLILYIGQQGAGAPLLAVRSTGETVPFPAIRIPFGGGGRVRFLPDGKSLVHVQGTVGAQDFWLLDLATGKSRQLTRLSSPGEHVHVRRHAGRPADRVRSPATELQPPPDRSPEVSTRAAKQRGPQPAPVCGAGRSRGGAGPRGPKKRERAAA